ncbi:hypothetical protein [Scrofimicrobium sp. R131]|uniref:CT398-like coiled coil hairpin domain-containing protein n=1 Tax=Scrofimicrobium appendicitidis TaxID=3079930 RepID=A0AAU7VAE4_9ACTO
MKALPLEQTHLVELQRLDLALARLRHQDRTHPARQEIVELAGRASDLQQAIVAAEARLDGASRQIEQVESEIEKVRQRRDLQQRRLDEGKVPIRDMSALEHEVASIETRIATLEDKAMELMEGREKLAAGIEAARQNHAALLADQGAAEQRLAADLAVTGEEIDQLEAQRRHVVELLPAQLVTAYEGLQARLGPRVVIEMHEGTLVDAPVELPLSELSELAMHPADQLYISDETEYLIART